MQSCSVSLGLQGKLYGVVCISRNVLETYCSLLVVCRQSHRAHRQKKDCQRLLDKLKREQEVAVATQQYPAVSCPVCLEDFETPADRDPAPSAPPLSAMMVRTTTCCRFASLVLRRREHAADLTLC